MGGFIGGLPLRGVHTRMPPRQRRDISVNAPAPSKQNSFRYRFTSALMLGLVRAALFLPYPLTLRVGKLIGRLVRRLGARRVSIARTNLALCFPELDDAARERLLRAHFDALGIGVLETGMAWSLPNERVSGLIKQVEGLEHLKRARSDGRGVILLSAHFTAIELGVRMLNLLTPIHPMYREHENPALRAIMHGSFKPHFEAVIPRDDVRGMVRSLRGGHAVWYAPDQNYGRDNRVFAPFFGVQAATNAATGRFARMTKSLVIPYFVYRLEDGSGYRLELSAPLADFPGEDDVSDATRVNALIEDWVRRVPQQYLWAHRRFKTRPQGEPDLYGM